jgi:5-methylcytosine-specific restriction endonuclease McrA
MPRSLSKPRRAAFIRQSGNCYYCGAPVWLDQPAAFADRYGISERLAARLQCTGEHLVARQDGGASSQENIVAACYFCNLKRHQRKHPPSPEVYRQLVRRRMRRRKWHPTEIHLLLGGSEKTPSAFSNAPGQQREVG